MKGRQSKYSDNLADIICERLVDGQSLRTICADADMPDRVTVMRWLHVHESFATKYARARELQGDYLAEEIIHIVDEEEDAQRARNRMLARQWYASKLKPKSYGDKQAVELSGSVDVKRSVAEMTDDELAAIATASGK